MHRTERSHHSLQPLPIESEFHVDSALFSRPETTVDNPVARFTPLHYEPGYAYPMVVWLHGPGMDERQLMRIMPLLSMRNYVAVAPRGPRLRPEGGKARPRYGWQQSAAAIEEAQQRIFEAIEAARSSFNVSPKRVFLAGFDCGGTMAFRVGLRHPHHFAGVVSLGGAFPAGHTPFGNLSQARRLPVLLATGRSSRRYPAETVCENLRLLHTAGVSITLRQYPCGHELSPQMLADADRWIIEQITSPEGFTD